MDLKNQQMSVSSRSYLQWEYEQKGLRCLKHRSKQRRVCVRVLWAPGSENRRNVKSNFKVILL